MVVSFSRGLERQRKIESSCSVLYICYQLVATARTGLQRRIKDTNEVILLLDSAFQSVLSVFCAATVLIAAV